MAEQVDLIVFSLPWALFKNGKAHPLTSAERATRVSAVQASCAEASTRFNIRMEPVFADDHQQQQQQKQQSNLSGTCTCVCTGLHGNISMAKQWILAQYPKQEIVTVRANAFDMMMLNEGDTNGSSQMKPAVDARLQEIMAQTRTNITINFATGQPPAGSALITVDTIGDLLIEVKGRFGDVERAKVLILVLLDKLAGYEIRSVEINRDVQVAASGRSRNKLRRIMEQTHANIYFPFACVDDFLSTTDAATSAYSGTTVYVSSPDKSQAEQAINDLKSMAAAVNIVSRDVVVPRKKLEFALRQRPRALCNLMSRCASLIAPDWTAMAGGSNQVVVYFSAAREASLTKAISEFMSIIGELAAANLHLSEHLMPAKPPHLTTTSSVPLPSAVQKLVQLSINYGVELTVVGNAVELTGDQLAMPTASCALKEIDELQLRVHEAHFQLEMSSEYKDFISGKKNGKLNKIMKSCSVNIQMFEPYPYVLVLEISSHHYANAYEAYQQLQDELPAEKEFYVPDVYHKRIIGVAGKNIQGIMKECGVYVKFLSSDDFKAFGGCFERENNVIARTPAKNYNNLHNLYAAVISLVNVKERDFVRQAVKCSRRYHRLIFGQKRKEIEDRTETIIDLPLSDSGSDTIQVRGLEKDIARAFEELRKCATETFVYLLPRSSQMEAFVSDKPAFAELQTNLDKLFNVRMRVLDDSSSAAASDVRLELSCNQSAAKRLPDCLDRIVKSLDARQIKLHSVLPDLRVAMAVESPAVESFAHKDGVLPFKPASKDEDSYSATMGNSMQQRSTTPQKLGPDLRTRRTMERSALGNNNVVVARPKLSIGDQLKDHNSNPNRHNGSRLKSAVDQVTNSGFASLSLNVNQHGGSTHRFAPGQVSHTVAGLISPRVDMHPGFFGSNGNNAFYDNAFGRDGAENNGTSASSSADKANDHPDDELMKSVIKSFMPLAQPDGAAAMPTTVSDDTGNTNGNRMFMLLDHLGMSKYKQIFADHDIDFEMFLTLTPEDFKELGVSVGARKKFTVAIEEVMKERASGQKYPTTQPVLSPLIHSALKQQSQTISASVPASPVGGWMMSSPSASDVNEWSPTTKISPRPVVMMLPSSLTATTPSLTSLTGTGPSRLNLASTSTLINTHHIGAMSAYTNGPVNGRFLASPGPASAAVTKNEQSEHVEATQQDVSSYFSHGA